MTPRARIIDPLAEPVPDAWDAFVDDQGVAAGWRSAVLGALAWCARHRVVLGLVTDEGGAPCALFAGRHVLAGRPHRYEGRAERRRFVPGMLECHLPPSVTASGHVFHADLDAPGRAAAVAAFERAAARFLGPALAGVVHRQVGEADLEAFRGPGRIVRPVLAESVVVNRWDTFDGYLASLPRRDRKNLRRLYRLVDEDPGVRTAVEPRLDGVEAARLAHTVLLRYAGGGRRGPNPLPSVYNDRLGGLPGVHYFTYREPDGALLAYGLLLEDGPALRCMGWGSRDAADGGRSNLYFDHFLRQIAFLVERDRDRLIMGKTMTELKERFGARNEPLYAVAGARRFW
ncbi:hypothetical protein DZF91_32175 [Actinomadura logoneensis]|uniref:Uncharacterized protein n=1 Tax=Actinomadura logoneensis TaxID=2293572 RepID=A0A372JC33_9ACTN|nr:hypothetical protein [Actinomadura logoneensis]RFU37571.1 hypothetical protein DZF91_32175 [Actinomadura logoneensis]